MKQLLLLISLLPLLAACNDGDNRIFQGYVEAEYVDVAAGVSGRLEELKVSQGEQVAQGQLLFKLEGETERTQAAASDARLRVVRLNLERLKQLEPGAFSSEQSLDQAEAALQVAEQEAKASAWRLGQTQLTASVAGRVDDLFYRSGEWVVAGRPVVRLLPQENVKLRFFVPESVIGSWKVGDNITATCDGCGEPVNAQVTFISTQAEFTPPVIFSREAREKLVVMMEADVSALDAARLHVGQPVDVVRSGP